MKVELRMNMRLFVVLAMPFLLLGFFIVNLATAPIKAWRMSLAVLFTFFGLRATDDRSKL